MPFNHNHCVLSLHYYSHYSYYCAVLSWGCDRYGWLTRNRSGWWLLGHGLLDSVPRPRPPVSFSFFRLPLSFHFLHLFQDYCRSAINFNRETLWQNVYVYNVSYRHEPGTRNNVFSTSPRPCASPPRLIYCRQCCWRSCCLCCLLIIIITVAMIANRASSVCLGSYKKPARTNSDISLLGELLRSSRTQYKKTYLLAPVKNRYSLLYILSKKESFLSFFNFVWFLRLNFHSTKWKPSLHSYWSPIFLW